MIFHNTKLPDDVSLALKKGELVIFVGAGISKPQPSNLPLFDGLVVDIGKQFGIDVKIDEIRGKEDRKLGEWHDEKHDIYKAVIKILGEDRSKPTELHHELFKIFKESKKVRIVTTNFDSHLSKTARIVFPNGIDEYYAPALPLGDDFEGLVYLHGSIYKKPERMVLTTEDFGKAYFSKGWAREFLLSLFSRYTVLFVGYSHSDVLVSYLEKGLKHAGIKPRWSLISSNSRDEEIKNWHNLGISTEKYLVDDKHPRNRHIALTEFFKDWVISVNESIFDRANRLKLTTKNKCPDDEATAELIDYDIKNPRLAQEFCNSIEDEDWISWMDKRGYFTPIFNDGKQGEDLKKKLKPNENIIAHWLCSFVRINYPERLLELIEKYHQSFNNDFADILAHELWTNRDKLNDPKFNTWVTLLVNKGPKTLPTAIWAYILKECKLPDNKGVALRILEILTTPELHLRKKISYPHSEKTHNTQLVDYGINWPREGDYWVKKIWDENFRNAIPILGDELMAIAVKQISSAQDILIGVGKANEYFDSLNRGRMSIALHDQDRNRRNDCLSALVDIARDILEDWLKNNTSKGQFYINIWRKSEVSLLKRLAVHGIGLDNAISCDDKIKWLLDNNLIYESKIKKEVFDVLKYSYPLASKKIRQSLLDYIDNRIKDDKKNIEITAYKKFNILAWLRKSDESCDLVVEALNEINKEFPKFEESEHPEFDFWFGETKFMDPKEGVDFKKILSEKPANYIESIISADEISIDQDKWTYLNNLQVLFEKNRAWSQKFIKNLTSQKIDDRQIWGSVFYAWREIIRSHDDWDWILGVIETLPKKKEIYAAASDLLSHGFWQKDSNVTDEIIHRGYAIISKTWELCKNDNTEIDEPSNDLLTSAINHEGGRIGEFLIHYISHLRESDKENWLGIPEHLKQQITQVIKGTGKTAVYGRIAIIPWTTYLFAWDKNFAKKYILPLFDWNTHRAIAEQTWPVYISYRRWARIDVEELLIPHYKQLVKQLNTNKEWKKSLINSNSMHNLGFNLAGLVIRVISNPLESGFINKVIPLLSEDILESLMRGMGNFLKELKPEEQIVKWELWINEYIENRLNGMPLIFSSKEAGAMVEWTLSLGDLFPSVVVLIEKMTLKQFFAYSYTKDALESPLLEKYPIDMCKFCVFVMRAEDYPFLDEHLLVLLSKFEALISGSEWLTNFKEELYNRGWIPDEK